MRFQLFVKTVFVGLGVFFGMFFAVSATQAQANPPAPTPRPQAAAPANAGAPFKVHLPIVQSNGYVAPEPLASKKGVGLTYNDCPTVSSVKAAWQYGWTMSPANCPNVENVPLMEGRHEINQTAGGNSQWLMGFNEPDLGWQETLSFADWAAAWREIEKKYPKTKLLAPAPSGGDPNWLDQFRNAYIAAYKTAPRFDGLAVHCYAWYASDCINHTKKFLSWANSWQVPEVWVTEFSFSPVSPSSQSQSLRETQTYVNWMTNEAKITRYAWFTSKVQGNEAWLSPYFVTPLAQWSDGKLTAFGSNYGSFH